MLSEPGDALAGLIHRELGSAVAIRDVLSGRAQQSWEKLLIARGAQEYLAHLAETIERFSLRLRSVDPEAALSRIQSLGGSAIAIRKETEIHHLFSDLDLHAPLVLWILGDSSAISRPAISIVGTRSATPTGIRNTTQLVMGLGAEVSVVSGGAEGIDSGAHRAALALGNKTVAYMAGGLDRLYPAKNLELFEQMKQQGALVSECAPGVAPTRWRFLQRNRLIAAHGSKTFVIEAAIRSGARNTAGHAFACGREVFAFVGPENAPHHQGCNLLVREGIARGISDPAKVFDSKPESQHLDRGNQSTEVRTLDALSRYPRTLERICLESGLSHRDASRALQNLARYRLVFSSPRGWMLI